MKIIRAYVIIAILCISVTVLTACIVIADENARKTTLGEDFAVVKISETKKAAGIAPPPIYEIILKTKEN